MTWICSQCGEKFGRYRTRCPADGQRVIEDLSGQLIGGRYQIRELIGVGGMDSTVWKAWQTGTERVVAVKVLPAADDAAARRFSRGARIAANLNHPNCTVVHDYGRSEDGKLFLVMEFLQGQVLQDVLGPDGMSITDTLHVVVQVLQALEHAHASRAVHRDLKPDNLFLCKKNDDDLHVKILDFGIAKYVEEDPEQPQAAHGQVDDFEDLVTEQRQVCGTPQYMAPEQVVGGRIDARTDLYALGCVMYRMLTGRLPFDGKTRYELYQRHLQESPRAFADVRPDIRYPDRLELIVMKALAKKPEQRFASATEMRRALETVESAPVPARTALRARPLTRDTSPNMPTAGVAETILPPNWTLSKPIPPPVPPTARGARPGGQVSPTASVPVVTPAVEPAAQGRTRNASRPRPVTVEAARFAADDTAPPPDVGPAELAKTGASPRPESGRDLPKPSPLNDAVVRHPPSRLTMAAVAEVPVSTETEPNRGGQGADARKKNLRVVAILAGAFLIGVGGVALAMRLASGGADDVTAEANELARAPTAGTVVGAAVPPSVRVETDMATAVDVALADVSTADAGPRPLDGGLAEVAEVSEASTKTRLTFETTPAGATVSAGLVVLGNTPLNIDLTPGPHALTVELQGFQTQRLEVVVGGEPLSQRVELVPVLGAKPALRTAPRAPLVPQAPVERAPAVTPVETPREKPAKPAVKLLEDEPQAPPPKKPEVKLLDEDEAPAAKPNIRTLGE